MAYTHGGSPRSRPLAHWTRPGRTTEAVPDGGRCEQRCPGAKGSTSAWVGVPSPAPVTLPGSVPLGTKSARATGCGTVAEREPGLWPGRGHVPAIALHPIEIESRCVYSSLHAFVSSTNDRLAERRPGEHLLPAPLEQTATVPETASRVGWNRGRNHTSDKPEFRAERSSPTHADSWRRGLRAECSAPLLRAARCPTSTASAARRAEPHRSAAMRRPPKRCTRRRILRAGTTPGQRWRSRSWPAGGASTAGASPVGAARQKADTPHIRPTHHCIDSHAVALSVGRAGGRGGHREA